MKKLAVLFLAAFMDLLHAVVPRKIHRQNPPQQKHQQLQPGQKLPIHSLFHLKKNRFLIQR